jgi:methylisocitrate lyase
VNARVRDLAARIWDYHLLHHQLVPSDAILVLCSHDTAVAAHAARLWLDGWAPLLIFAGGLGTITRRLWNEPEADQFARIAVGMGVPADRILIENGSTNTGENVRFTKTLLERRGLDPARFILVQKPYMERRSYATFRKVWPDKAVVVTSPPASFDDYLANYSSRSLSPDDVVGIIVGDLQRIRTYPALGFQIEQEMPEDVWAAAEELVRLGYGDRLRSAMPSTADRTTAFRNLHESGCFVIPNPWDAGTARVLAQLGFPALASTSSGSAWSMGHRDHQPSLEQTLAHLRLIAESVSVPVNADFEGGFAVSPADVAVNVGRAVATGVAGLSIEDSTGDPANPLFDFDLAVERIRAARTAIDASGVRVLLTGRSEGFIVGRPDLAETIRRLTAYAAAGAECLYAPGLSTIADVAAVVTAVAPLPVNALARPTFTVAELANAGVRRISVGGALARVAWTAFLDAAKEVSVRGTFTAIGSAIPGAELNGLFGSD